LVFIFDLKKERINPSIIIYESISKFEKLDKMELYLVSIITTEVIEKSTEKLKVKN